MSTVVSANANTNESTNSMDMHLKAEIVCTILDSMLFDVRVKRVQHAYIYICIALTVIACAKNTTPFI